MVSQIRTSNSPTRAALTIRHLALDTSILHAVTQSANSKSLISSPLSLSPFPHTVVSYSTAPSPSSYTHIPHFTTAHDLRSGSDPIPSITNQKKYRSHQIIHPCYTSFSFSFLFQKSKKNIDATGTCRDNATCECCCSMLQLTAQDPRTKKEGNADWTRTWLGYS
jgi:hypothetical protein